MSKIEVKIEANEDVAVEILVETVPLTLEIAKHYNRMATLKGDRDPDLPKGRCRVEALRRQNVGGLFHSPEWSDVLVSAENGKKYRVDGGHSARMLVQSNSDFPEGLSVTLRHFRAPTIKSAQMLYTTFNQQFSTRTKLDTIKNWAGYVSELNNISPSAISLAISGIAYYYKVHNTDKIDQLDFIEMYPEFIAWTNNLTVAMHMKKTGMMGAVFATWAFNESIAKEFWVMVREGDGATKECPARVLHRFLRDIMLDRTIKWDSRALYVKCCHAWNAWRLGKTTHLSYFKAAPPPKLI